MIHTERSEIHGGYEEAIGRLHENPPALCGGPS